MKYHIQNIGQNVIEFSVVVNHYTTTTKQVSISSGSENECMAKLLGVLYRYAIVVFYQGELATLTAADVLHPYADTSWSPVKLTCLACQIVTQTHDFPFTSVLLIPESMHSCTLTVAKTGIYPGVNVHLQYKGHAVQVVVRKGTQSKLVRSVAYPDALQFFCTEGGFLWKGQSAAIVLLLHRIWQLLVIVM